MSDFAGIQTDPEPPPFLSNFSRWGSMFGVHGADDTINPISATYTTGNQARYYPMSLPWPYLVKRVFWANGSSVSGTRDFGIYASNYELIYSTGSTSASGGTALQFVTPGTPILLQPGEYYFGFNCSATTNAVWGKTVPATSQRLGGVMQQAVGAVTLPDPMVPAAASVATVNICGVTWTTTGF